MGLFGWKKKPAADSTTTGAPQGASGASGGASAGKTGAPGPSAGWRAVVRSDADTADVLAYATGLVEGRLAGKYMLSSTNYQDTVVVLGVKSKGIVAGAHVHVPAAPPTPNNT